MSMKYIDAKTIIISKSYPEWFNIRYNMNIYKGCQHGCIYCDSRSDCYQNSNFDEIVAKKDALKIIERELKSKRKKGIIGTGAMSDPYNLMERKYQLTRGALKLFNSYGFGVSLITKSDLVTRDIDLFQKIGQHSSVCIGLTITAASDSLAKKIEPVAPSSSKRFLAIKKLTEKGIYAGILMMPILPFISDKEENILTIIKNAAQSGVKFIYPLFGLTLRRGQREYFYSALDKLFPGLSQKYKHFFGNKYECLSPEHQKLSEVFKNACEKYSIVYKMSEIVKAAEDNVQIQQLPLF